MLREYNSESKRYCLRFFEWFMRTEYSGIMVNHPRNTKLVLWRNFINLENFMVNDGSNLKIVNCRLPFVSSRA